MAGGKTVLVVDDQADAVAIVDAMLSELDGVRVIEANDGASGLERARADAPDMILLDVQMPGMSGFDVFRELRKDERTRGIPVVMLTGVSGQTGIAFSGGDMAEFLGEAPQGYVEKPVSPELLQGEVKRVLGL